VTWPFVVVDAGDYRVIECRDCMQWIVQVRSGQEWRSVRSVGLGKR
jgi:hypothetical protein